MFCWTYQGISSIVADKFKARDYVIDRGYKHILNGMIGSWDNVNGIPRETLPNKFALICGYGCGMNIICFDKNKFDIENAKNKLIH